MPKLPQIQLDARREGIVRAALRCLERHGIGGFGMRHLFRAANLSPGAVYRYFSGKEELIAEVAARLPSALGKALESPRRGAPEHRLEALLAAIAGAPGGRLRLELRAAARHAPAVALALRERHREDRRRLAAALDLDAGGAPTDDLAELILALGQGLALLAHLEPETDLARLCTTAARRLAAAGS